VPSYDEECTGGYECEAWSHVDGCLSHSIDPPTEFQLAAQALDPPDELQERLMRRGARVYRDEE
jgi:hypothetical protein